MGNAPPPPTLLLKLQPTYVDGRAIGIHVWMRLDILAKAKGDVLFRHILKRGPTKTQQYRLDAITVRSPDGIVDLESRDSVDGRLREFCIAADLDAPWITVEHYATAATVHERSPCGPQIALECDGDGISACGMAFLLSVVDPDYFRTIISWNLSGAPSADHHGVCTWGEGEETSFYGQPSLLEETFFMVGPVKSVSSGRNYGMYWLSQPPFDAEHLGMQVEAFVHRTRLFFADDDPLFRVFIRRNKYKCTSGRGIHRGFVFAWNDIQKSKSDQTEFVFHEIIHNWPRLGFSIGGPTRRELEDGWFNEGIAEYYSLILPFRFGIFDEAEFVWRFNNRLSGYYTNPDRGLPNSEVPDNFWKAGHADRIPYQRGFMYFVDLHCKLRQAGGRSLDALIKEMVTRREHGHDHNIDIWLKIVAEELGPTACDDYRDMSQASVIRLPEDCNEVLGLDPKWSLRREDQEEFYLGFPESCLGAKERVVSSLDLCSRAADAGVRNGDAITARFSYLFDAEIWNENFAMTVMRDGVEVDLEWWPRSRVKVESYQFRKASIN